MGHYFDDAPEASRRPRTVDLALPDLSLQLATDSGVFSGDRVDAGTKLLLLEAPKPPADAKGLLDLGCGYGPIAVTLALRAPGARVIAVDPNERARELCAANATAAGATNVEVSSPDDVDADATFDAIYSNPPIRIGKAKLHELLLRWLPRLTPQGRAYLVVARNLGADSLANWLIEAGHPCKRVVTRQGYRVLEVAPKTPESETPT